VYGGYWKAEPVSPPGLTTHPIYGRSTNQEMLNGSREVELAVDDLVFFRPTQSEFVMLQFGPIAAVRAGRIVDYWEPLPQGA
jgi:D-serine deaminase-like pyridoxal phosphate-dependent protein